MDMNIHNVESVTIEKRQFDAFGTLALTITDRDGHESTITLFTDDLAKLNINTATIKAEQF